MPHLPSPQLDTRRSYYADVHDIAHAIQNNLKEVLRPPQAGVYLPNQMEPVLRADREYWYQEPVFTKSPLPLGGSNQPWQYYRYNYIRVTNFEQVLSTPWDVVEMNRGFVAPYINNNDPMSGTQIQPRVVALPAHLAQHASLTPTLPAEGIKIALAMIEADIGRTRLFANSPPKTIEEIILPYVDDKFFPAKPDYVNGKSVAQMSLDYLRSNEWFQKVCNGIFEDLLMVLNPIRSILRHNPWQMCSVEYQDNYNFRVDQLGDYRIHEWEKIVNDPDYQAFQRAKADGSWARFMQPAFYR